MIYLFDCSLFSFKIITISLKCQHMQNVLELEEQKTLEVMQL